MHQACALQCLKNKVVIAVNVLPARRWQTKTALVFGDRQEMLRTAARLIVESNSLTRSRCHRSSSLARIYLPSRTDIIKWAVRGITKTSLRLILISLSGALVVTF